ncbi:MAG: knotted carbamoyltransferase YgeW [Candidatus Aminicenantes bacterium]|nr:knotted carbamoyltransferase YgeW [Candidatus Aminicenantes bacterium]
MREFKWLDPETDLSGQDFFLTWEKSLDQLRQILLTAEMLKYYRENNISTRCFDSGLAVSQFRDNSTRTRFSFASAANLLGLTVQDLDEGKSQVSHGETVRETANMISFLTEIIGIRDDMYLGAGNAYMREVAAALDDGFEKGVLPQRPGVVNLQCDIDHPTQTLADLLHLKDHFEGLEWLQCKKIAMTWAYSPSYGKPLSVPQGVIGLMTRFGMHVVLAHPPGYNLTPEVVALAKENVTHCGGKFEIVDSMAEAFADADIVYPKSWAPYSTMQQRTVLLQNNNQEGLRELEKECLAQNARFKDWTCTEEKMKKTRNGEALYLHCLPADISGVSCREGEVSAGVFEKYRIATYKEAGYKPYIIAAMILNNRFREPLKILHTLEKRNIKRVL